jgi:hypothetical protein
LLRKSKDSGIIINTLGLIEATMANPAGESIGGLQEPRFGGLMVG